MQVNRTKLLAGTAALIGALAITACIPPAPEPTPAPSPAPVAHPTQAPPQAVTPTYDNWMDVPQTPGNWSYSADRRETRAVFGTGNASALIIRCDLGTRQVAIARSGSAAGPVQMRIRTESQDRVLTADPATSASGTLATQLNARDTLLDAIAFSKGRFAVETASTPTIYVPAYPEITRVVEDCRS